VSHPQQSGAFAPGRIGTLAPIPDPSPPTGPDDAAEDAALVRRARGGDREALERLLRDHYNQIHAVCRRITGNAADAADAAQNSLIAVTRGLPRFDDRSRFSSWAYRIAVNCSIDELRRRSRSAVVSLDDPDHAGLRDRAAPLVAAPSDDPELAGIRVDLDGALRRLRLEFRAPLVLRDLCGLDYAEIAEILELPAGTVRSRIARGRAALVRLLEPSRSEP
jgi:RNA polymerase sigma-70 factor (ECF subfamily)